MEGFYSLLRSTLGIKYYFKAITSILCSWKEIVIPLMLVFLFQATNGQQENEYMKKNHLFAQINHHFEKRSTEGYVTSNPDLAFGYERDIVGFGDHRFLAGVRTGYYREYVLTGDGWDHPEKNRFFLGLSPSYMLHINKNFRMQLNFLYDVLLPDDYDEIWSYWAIEPSFQYFFRNTYIGISATRGVFLFFDPKAYMVKAGIKVGYRF